MSPPLCQLSYPAGKQWDGTLREAGGFVNPARGSVDGAFAGGRGDRQLHDGIGGTNGLPDDFLSGGLGEGVFQLVVGELHGDVVAEVEGHDLGIPVVDIAHPRDETIADLGSDVVPGVAGELDGAPAVEIVDFDVGVVIALPNDLARPDGGGAVVFGAFADFADDALAPMEDFGGDGGMGDPGDFAVPDDRRGVVELVVGDLFELADVEAVPEDFVVVAIPRLKDEFVVVDVGIQDVEIVGGELGEVGVAGFPDEDFIAIGPAAGALEGDARIGHDGDAEMAGAGADASDSTFGAIDGDVAGLSRTAPHLALVGVGGIEIDVRNRQVGRRRVGGISGGGIGLDGGPGRGKGRVEQPGIFRLHLPHLVVFRRDGQFEGISAVRVVLEPSREDDGIANDQRALAAAVDEEIVFGDVLRRLPLAPDEDVRAAGSRRAVQDIGPRAQRRAVPVDGIALPSDEAGFADGGTARIALGVGEGLDGEIASGGGPGA